MSPYTDAAESRGRDSLPGDLLRIALAILLPPLGVLLEVGVANKHFWINIVLTLLGFLPGVIHAVWVIARY
ncbi:YqaE/Pmp3 family membrane protein [uncultured Rhodospira sp.]|uniref:YqaE/Pmp3 family membrane protein n=1 Tax=uncultured Rhodospira sp. TaxID=1936189 RepID=UPI00260D01A3|nr:YqaE/Pmp3 family membrane protein [uncultured Rhodospira sp.]